MNALSLPPAEALSIHVAAIGQGTGFIELRYRRPNGHGMGQAWREAHRSGEIVDGILALAARTDVYVGAAPRTERSGSKRAVAHAHCLWVDCDNETAADRVREFHPDATFLIRSGGEGGLHAWWALKEPLAAPNYLERALRRLAHYLGGDPACCDSGWIMRPGGSFNYNPGTPRLVVIERVNEGAAFAAADSSSSARCCTASLRAGLASTRSASAWTRNYERPRNESGGGG